MSRDFGIFMPKHLAEYYLLNSYDLSKLGDTLAKEHYLTLEKNASDCLQCGHCNSRCPFSVDQMSRMQEIEAYFTAK